MIIKQLNMCWVKPPEEKGLLLRVNQWITIKYEGFFITLIKKDFNGECKFNFCDADLYTVINLI